MKLGKDQTYQYEAAYDRWFFFTVAAKTPTTVAYHGEPLLSFSWEGGAVTLQAKAGGECFTISGSAAEGEETVVTEEGRRLALYVNGRLLGERYLPTSASPHPFLFEGVTVTAGAYLQAAEGYAYSAGWEAVAVKTELALPKAPFAQVNHQGSVHCFYRRPSGVIDHFAQMADGVYLCPAVASPLSWETEEIGVGCAVSAFGGLYVFLPLRTKTGGCVAVYASKDGVHFAKAPFVLAEGSDPRGCRMEEKEGKYLLHIEGAVPVILQSTDLYHWN